MRVSVVLAAYNGKKYINQQIESILRNLDAHDELIISDDGSTDGTYEIANNWSQIDARIKLINGPRSGIVKNFESLLSQANGEVVFFSDQDDVWDTGKVRTIKRLFESDHELTCVLHDVRVVNENLEVLQGSFFKMRGSRSGLTNNLIKNSYMGSAMAVRSDMRKYILPIPEHVPMHDQWIGLVNEVFGKTMLVHKTLSSYRRHEDNNSSLGHGSVAKMIYNRIYLIYCLTSRIKMKFVLKRGC